MPNHGFCKNCWWWKEIPTIATVWQEVERKGQCFMHTHGGHNEYTEENFKENVIFLFLSAKMRLGWVFCAFFCLFLRCCLL